jgi:hypothetical protein
LNDWAHVVNASFSDAAADTVSVGVEPPPPLLLLLLPQPATTSKTAHSAAAVSTKRCRRGAIVHKHCIGISPDAPSVLSMP